MGILGTVILLTQLNNFSPSPLNDKLEIWERRLTWFTPPFSFEGTTVNPVPAKLKINSVGFHKAI